MVIVKEALNAHMLTDSLSFANATLHSRHNFAIVLLEEAAKNLKNNANMPTGSLIFDQMMIARKIIKEKLTMIVKIEDTIIVNQT
jgi:hypothetical protein